MDGGIRIGDKQDKRRSVNKEFVEGTFSEKEQYRKGRLTIFGELLVQNNVNGYGNRRHILVSGQEV